MIVLKILGWTLLCLLALLVLVALLPVGLRFRTGMGERMRFLVKVAGIKVWENKASSQESEKETPADKPSKKQDLGQTVKSVIQLLRLLLEQLPRLLGGIRVKKLELVCIAAHSDAADAAMQYGVACSVLYPLIEYLQYSLHAKQQAMQVDIRCDFEKEKAEFLVDTELSMQVWHVLCAALRIMTKKLLEDAANE